MIQRAMLQPERCPAAPAAPASPGLASLSATNRTRAAVAITRSFTPPHALHLRRILALLAVGGVTPAARIGYSLRADRRYAELLEREVTRQTRTLMDSLAAAGAAERNLRLVLEAVPDSVVLLDRDGHMLEFNPAAHHGFPTPPQGSLGRSAFDALQPAAPPLVPANPAAAL